MLDTTKPIVLAIYKNGERYTHPASMLRESSNPQIFGLVEFYGFPPGKFPSLCFYEGVRSLYVLLFRKEGYPAKTIDDYSLFLENE